MLKIFIVSGFLGAGKTTFIKTLSQKINRDFCVLENEYAQADIDKAILSQDASLNIWELTENCICCSGKQDFANTILTIANTINPEYLIVEPTGVAKLSSLVANIAKIQYGEIALLRPITLIDYQTIDRYQKEYPEIYLDQIKHADQIILSKVEHADQESLQHVTDSIRAIHPGAEILTTHYSSMPTAWWEMLLRRHMDGTIAEDAREEGETTLENLSLSAVSLPTPVHLISLADMISFGVFGKIIRAKGFIPCGGMWLRFDYVERQYLITGAESEPQEARVVFIGEDINRESLRRVFQGRLFRKPQGEPDGSDEETYIYRAPSEMQVGSRKAGKDRLPKIELVSGVQIMRTIPKPSQKEKN